MDEQTPQFAFVAGGASGKPRSVDRKLIRSHCMRGKNRREPVEQPVAQWLGPDDAPNPSARPLLLSFSVSTRHEEDKAKVRRSTARNSRRTQQLHAERAANNITACPIPNPPLLRFADQLGADSVELLFTVFPGTLRAFSLADFSLPSNLKSSQWRDWLFTDVAYVHAAITVSAVVRDLLLKRESSKIPSFHLRKAISQLNKNLSYKPLSLSDATIAVIISLSMASWISQDYVSTSSHVAGLSEIVRLRGGLDSFHSNPQLQVGMTRIDLCVSLGSGKSPIFTTGPSTFPYEFNTVQLSTCDQKSVPPDLQFIENLVDDRVAAIFQDLQGLARSMNAATSSQRVMLASDFHAGVMSIQYRLFKLHSKLNDIISEWIRVAMLASLTTTFQVMGSRIKYQYLSNRLQELCCAVEVSTEELRPVMFWVLMVGTVALFDSEEPWLSEKWRLDVLPLVRGLQWEDAKRLLKRFIWIDACNGKAGRAIFNKIIQDLGNGSRHERM
ncbi:hypothetical protein BP6252_03994 [Coleophoma cylindrospora]|uniref:Uncharacterized protein n=1 Tax=Coleophoma cylindrospora TaxID=1849047 RepID=A0A3D8RZ95_9HELO|nr:hypothetical protein BP6252_03994 [Coleophoma cylindrospora]